MGVTHANDDTLMATIRARALLVIEDDAPIRRALQNALSDVAEAYGLVIDIARRRVARGQTMIRLTPIEWDILRTLVSNAGRTLTHQQIFDAVWGSALGSPQQYLRVHVTNLRRKIEANPAR